MADFNFQTEDTKMTAEARPQRKSKQHGTTSEVSIFYKIKPGRAEYIRKVLKEFDEDPRRLPNLERMGILTEARYVVMNNDTQIGLFTAFDGSWDAYIEDFYKSGFLNAFDRIYRDNVEGWPTKPLAEITVDEFKAAFQANQVTAAAFVWMHYDKTLKQIQKAWRVYQAFQKVLDDPAAQKALENPALKPLLAEAAD
jgi:hypothetical protein